jgi:hypothetical protein
MVYTAEPNIQEGCCWWRGLSLLVVTVVVVLGRVLAVVLTVVTIGKSSKCSALVTTHLLISWQHDMHDALMRQQEPKHMTGRVDV